MVIKPRQPTVCVIGAGASGLCVASHALREGLEVTLFEQQNALGGTWVYSDEINVFSSLYEKMNTNLPKEIMRFEDVPFETGDSASFVSHQQVRAYLDKYAEPVKHLIQFNTTVVNVQRTDSRWAVTVKNTKQMEADQTVDYDYSAVITPPTITQKHVEVTEFDVLFVCNGHFSQPRLPGFVERLQLPWLHCHNYRRPRPYSGQTVAIVGAGPSGTDIAIQVSKYAEKVYLIYNQKTKFGLAENVIPKPKLVDISSDGRGLILENGEVLHDVHQVVFCTGYAYSMPFFAAKSPKSPLQRNANDSYIGDLYQHLVHPEYPRSLFFVGLCWSLIPFVLFDHQAHYALALALNKVPVPSKEAMEQFEQQRLAELKERNEPVGFYHRLGHDQWPYFELLSQLANRPHKLPPVFRQIYDHVEQQRRLNLATYKSHCYKVKSPEEFEHLALNHVTYD